MPDPSGIDRKKSDGLPVWLRPRIDTSESARGPTVQQIGTGESAATDGHIEGPARGQPVARRDSRMSTSQSAP